MGGSTYGVSKCMEKTLCNKSWQKNKRGSKKLPPRDKKRFFISGVLSVLFAIFRLLFPHIWPLVQPDVRLNGPGHRRGIRLRGFDV